MDSALAKLVNEKFNTPDQQQFYMHFQMYLSHGDDESHVVDLDAVYEWLGFARKDPAKRVLTKNFELGTDYTVRHRIVEEDWSTTKRLHGGCNKETIMMSVSTFKHMCMLSQTEKGKETRRYYVNMERIFLNYAKQNSLKQTQKLEQLENSLQATDIVTHQKLVEAYHNKSCVYIARISEIDDNKRYVVKVGETDDIRTRMRTHRGDFEVCVLLDAFACTEAHKLEQYVLKRPDVLARRIPSTETIQLDDSFTLDTLCKIIKSNVANFENGPLPTAQRLEIQRMKTIASILNSDIDQDTKKKYIDELLPEPAVTSTSTDVQQPNSDRRVYKYHVDDLTKLVGTFNSLREAARSTGNINTHDYHIRDACGLNTVVDEHRWVCVDKSPDNPTMTPPDPIPETFHPPKIERKHQKKMGMVAQICPTSNTIVNVFACVKDAANAINLSGCSVSLGLHRGTKHGGFFWKLLEDCDQALRDSFVGSLPEPLRRRTCSKPIAQIDPQSREVIEVHDNQQTVTSKFKICAKKLNELCKSGDIYKNFIWAQA